MSWIFQGNPKYFDIDDYLSRCATLIYWRAPRHRGAIELGDRAYIWRAGALSGVVAVGEIIELPIERSHVRFREALSENLWHDKVPDPTEKVVGIEPHEVRLAEYEGMISRATLVNDAVLKESTIIRAPQGTVFRLTPQQGKSLSSYWRHGVSGLEASAKQKGHLEGAVSVKFHRSRERKSGLRHKKIEQFRARNNGSLFCQMCGLEPGRQYPEELAESVIEVHHLKPLSEASSPRPTDLDELLVVCANCHRAIHSSTEVEENTKLLKAKVGGE